MSPPRPIIIEDSAEQTPLRFSRGVDVIRGSLFTGDYGIVAPDVREYITRKRRPTRKEKPPPGFPALTASGMSEHLAIVDQDALARAQQAQPLSHFGERFTAPNGGETARVALLPLRVERKSLPDLVACCTTERERFEQMLSRMGAAFRPGRAVIVVEASFDEAAAGIYRSATRPVSVIGSTIAWHHDYGIPTMWLGSPGECARWVERWLVMALERHVEAGREELAEREAIQATEDTDAINRWAGKTI